jgi:hypothetical protein
VAEAAHNGQHVLVAEPVLLDALRALPRSAQVDLAVRAASLIAPYGRLDADVVDPDEFTAWVSVLSAEIDTEELARVRRGCELIVAAHPSSEPEGDGFFAFGAVVSVLFAIDVLNGSGSDAIVNAAKRFLDLTGCAEDDGAAGLYSTAVEWLARPAAATESVIRRMIVADAAGRHRS